ncbi:competence type IV pilus ATPase ComGA [Paraliobacillus sp. JSM ZJ581]|uniref:competence type IV pilus ATPase ComGA n=1 Tax=Paraliobacillus sp. JSM ZJ581 TaxID=3342118 RepID=UPI0035A91E0C
MSTTSVFSKKILYDALDNDASDIHFCPFSSMVKIYLRIHGERVLHNEISLNQYNRLISYFKFTAGMDIGEKRKPQNGAIIINYQKRSIALRISSLPVHQSESLAIRLLPQNEATSLNQLFLFPYQLKQIKKWVSHRSGVILFTGPTGSGKTTTLYALLQTLLKEHSYQTITLEDPIEKEIENLLQVQVNEKSGVSYHVGLKAALRHDPDIIMVGEIRDEKTAQFVFHAAYTGHLVLSTLHAKDAFGTIYRLKEMGISQTDLRQSLIAVASLELLPILINNTPSRAAISELLEGNLLHEAIGSQKTADHTFHTFKQLRRKAYAYGFTNKT